ncbi:MAG: alpha/beta hydrolase [Planctomycetes bacterium]|nr:alpha/beta hydrolase [Planctomycetota bacterium]
MQSLVRLLTILSFAVACAAPPPAAAEVPISPVVRAPFAVDLGGWTSAAEVVHPDPAGAHGRGPWPVVLLVHGNGPHDMDVTLSGPDGPTKMFASIADALAARGFAVVRYHKRFVKGPGRFDARFWREQSTPVFAVDAGRVLDSLAALPVCDRSRMFVWGWSEGTAIAAELATKRQDVRGLVLQGPVGLPWREMVRGWILDVGLPYASLPDGSGVTSESLAAALNGHGGMVAKLGASFFADPASARTPKPAVSPLLDANGDGRLDPDTEVRANVERMLDFAFSKQGNVWIYAEGRTLPTCTEQAAHIAVPVLILQGTNDASTPLRAGRVLEEALKREGKDATLWELPGLGHMLCPAASTIDDSARAPDAKVLVRAAGWLAARSSALTAAQ